MPDQRKVLIVGAGPAGAALGQVLRRYEIPFEIFEREDDLHARKGGGFTLDDVLSQMTELLPTDLGDWWTNSVNYLLYDTSIQLDGQTNTVTGYQTGFNDTDTRPHAIVVTRQKFRSWMIQHLPIQRNKTLIHYTQDTSGVTAYFNDGTSAHGTLLVGADGASSVVRKQMLNNPRPELHTFVPICGDFTISGTLLHQLRRMASAGIAITSPDAMVFFSQLELNADATEARYWWVVTFRSADPTADTAWVRNSSKAALFEKAMSHTKGMPDFVTETLRSAGAESAWNPQIRFSEYVPPETLPAGRVTLLGDAAHNTTPYGGMGANTGLKDAFELGVLLRDEKWKSSDDVQRVLDSYTKVMLPRGRSVVLSSRAIGEDESAGVKHNNPDILPWHSSIRTLEEPVDLEEFIRSGVAAAGGRLAV